MEESGRRTRWGSEIQRLFGSEFYNHVIYFDTVGCSFSSVLQTVVITDTSLYLYPCGSKERPIPFCNLEEISDLDSDHEFPDTFREHKEYEPHRILFSFNGQFYALYTFETGNDLFWKLQNGVDSAKRHILFPNSDDISIDPSLLRTVTHNNQTTPLLTFYTQKFNKIASHVMHENSFDERIKALEELQEISLSYFPVRILFFQSSYLLQYLMDTLLIFSDSLTVPPNVTINRVQQITLVKKIFELFQYYLRGSASVRDAIRLVSFNQGEHFRSLFKSLFTVEYFILSEKSREVFYLKKVSNRQAYLDELQVIESLVPSICYQLFCLSNMVKRNAKDPDSTDIFTKLVLEFEDKIVSGSLNSVAFTTVQMGYLIDGSNDLPPVFAFSFLDHLWFIETMCKLSKKAERLLKTEFETEIQMVLTDERIAKKHFPGFPLFNEIELHLFNIKKMLKIATKHKEPPKYLPVLFR